MKNEREPKMVRHLLVVLCLMIVDYECLEVYDNHLLHYRLPKLKMLDFVEHHRAC